MSRSRILVVDDEPDVVEFIKVALEAAQFEVIPAYDGLEALDLAETERPDLILLDLLMPMMSGYEVAEQLKANTPTQGIPIMCLTSASNVDARVKSRQAGAVSVLLKPFTGPELVAEVRKHLPAQSGRE